jgi:hypothetical protein
MLNHRIEEQEAVPVTLPKLSFQRPPLEDASETAAKLVELRIVRAGVDAWAAIARSGTFAAWAAIGKALQVGRDHALRVTGANRPMGRRYAVAFSEWINRHGFDKMPKSTRSVALELNENIAAVEAWRATLTDRERRRCAHPLSNVRRWRAATRQNKAKGSDDVAKAVAAWHRFVACLEALPADQAQPLWRDIYERAAAATGQNLTPQGSTREWL